MKIALREQDLLRLKPVPIFGMGMQGRRPCATLLENDPAAFSGSHQDPPLF
jgi:hypothetical protein